MADWKEVELPERMRSLPVDARGYPIPFTTYRDVEGTAFFAVSETAALVKCQLEGLCPVCGQGLDPEKWFVGGPVSAFDPNGGYLDPPLHRECMEYAMRVCPYLSSPKYMGRAGAEPLDYSTLQNGGQRYMDPSVIPVRPVLFVAVACREWKQLGDFIGARVTLRGRILAGRREAGGRQRRGAVA